MGRPADGGGQGRFSCRVGAESEGRRIDAFLAECMAGASRGYVQSLIESGAVTVDGAAAALKSRPVREGETVEANIPPPVPALVEAEDLPLRIVFEDDDILVVDKDRGMVVHPAPGSASGTLVNAVLFHCGDRLSSINGVMRPGIVHRIDKDTSGLLVVAKSDAAHRSLSAALAAHEVTRRYEAIVYSNFAEDEGTVDAPIGRDPGNRLRHAALKAGRAAVTHYRVVERFGDFTRLSLSLETGRTHQIRVHMAHIKHPLLGDPLYGPKKNAFGLRGQMLHAGVLGFRHPATGSYIEFSSPPPECFLSVLARLRGDERRR
ncbi:MAG: RluA family pseudouridine synthase [Clostridiales Family XIII bacterium]|jgi:23S rRNA pseudouridine1911/1915/1917 synthase|nr:RluA family pseudouridine synthase [Clostridiales Family XIII bacterium]